MDDVINVEEEDDVEEEETTHRSPEAVEHIGIVYARVSIVAISKVQAIA